MPWKCLPRALRDVDATDTVQEQNDELEEIDIEDVELDDPTFESLLVGRKVKVLLKDVDRIRWNQDLVEDRDRLAGLYVAAVEVEFLVMQACALRGMIEQKVKHPINPNNRKVIVFTAFADTARYLYEQISPWAKDTLGIDLRCDRFGSNQTTLAQIRKDLAYFFSRPKSGPKFQTKVR